MKELIKTEVIDISDLKNEHIILKERFMKLIVNERYRYYGTRYLGAELDNNKVLIYYRA